MGAGATNVQRSPSLVSDGSRKSIRSSGYGQASNVSLTRPNRMYSPNGTMRNPTQGYSGKSGGNRVRRDGAVAGSTAANHMGNTPASGSKASLKGGDSAGFQRHASRKSFGSQGAFGRGAQLSDRSHSNYSDKPSPAAGKKSVSNAAQNNKFSNVTRAIQPKATEAPKASIMSQQQNDIIGNETNIDDKIQKL